VRVSVKWLNELVPIDAPVEVLAERLSFSGTKVETITRLDASIKGIVVAEVVDITPHPNADNLTLVEVRVDGDETDSVVCGARNFSVGDRVPFAPIGARLGDVDIKERTIRGEVSHGMLCSAAELGTSKDHSGILVLPSEAALGADVVGVLGLDDTVLELEITPNRGDCMGMIGIAREVAALFRTRLVIPEADLSPDPSVASPVKVQIEDPEGCPRYVARYLEGIEVGATPRWISARLMIAGFRSISSVVDATNYVLLETGHPLHPFDADKISDHEIIVRRATHGEVMKTLDGVTRNLDPDDLVIADAHRPLAIAGVMGGEDSEVSDATSAVILESAYFEPSSIAFTARRHLLRTEASARFERGADPEILPYAAARAASLITELARGRLAAAEVDEHPRAMERPRITLRTARTDALLGAETSPDEQAQLLRSIGLGVEEAGDRLRVQVPSFRHDLEREVDLIEEVGRLAGYARLPSTLPPGRPGALSRAQASDRRVRRTLAARGLHEAWTSSFMAPADLEGLALASDHPARKTVVIRNPMSEEQRLLRSTLVPGLLRSAAHNLAQGADGVALFEVAHVYRPTNRELPAEPTMLGAVLSGVRTPARWNARVLEWDFFGAKGVLESVFEALGLGAPAFEAVGEMPFHPTRAGGVSFGATPLGVIGELHPDVCGRWQVGEGTVVFEVALDPVFAAVRSAITVSDLPRFPPVYIDLAVVVGEEVAAGAVEEVIRATGAPEVTATRLFDIYRGDQIAPDRKSLAYALEMRAPDRTLTSGEAIAVRDRIVEALRTQLRAELRG
jgi:phenylalanyl-tRNA synthetase beta chain